MKLRMLLALAGLAVAILSGTAPRPVWAQVKSGEDIYIRCAQACAECKTSCAKCEAHCTALVKAGMKEHERSLRLSADCHDICAAAEAICARKGPMSASICIACKKACDACGAECGKHSEMAVMKECAASCAACSKACSALIAAAASSSTSPAH